jgi:hypothetical protein
LAAIVIVREGHDGEQGRHVVESVHVNIAISISIRALGPLAVFSRLSSLIGLQGQPGWS